MKNSLKILSILFLFSVLVSCNSNKNKEGDLISTDVINNPKSAEGENQQSKMPQIAFPETEHDFGRVIEGEIVTYNFKFENTGKNDLLISAVSASCGCTASDYPTQPIKPGEEGVIKITFDSSKRKGYQSKTAVVLANTQPNKTVLRIKAMVVNPEKM